MLPSSEDDDDADGSTRSQNASLLSLLKLQKHVIKKKKIPNSISWSKYELTNYLADRKMPKEILDQIIDNVM